MGFRYKLQLDFWKYLIGNSKQNTKCIIKNCTCRRYSSCILFHFNSLKYSNYTFKYKGFKGCFYSKPFLVQILLLSLKLKMQKSQILSHFFILLNINFIYILSVYI